MGALQGVDNMKNTIIVSFICIIFYSGILSQTKEIESGKYGLLIVIIKGLENNNGDVQIGLFNSTESYNGKSPKFKGSIIKVKNRTVEWRLENIPFGMYAIKAFHDENSNNEIDTNFLGIPTENYGFSNNARSLFGPPSFEDAKFKFNSIEMKIEITLK